MNRLIISLLLFPFLLTAQQITHGPIWGAITSSQARVYLRSSEPCSIQLLWSADSLFQQSEKITASTLASNDNSVVLTISALKPHTTYYVKTGCGETLNGPGGRFTTFPLPGDTGEWVIVTGSCQETANMKVFDVIPKHYPLLLMHTGDFTYPDYQIKPDYANNMDTVALAYRRRYEEKTMREMLHSIPIDYMHDDNDYVGGSGGRFCKNDFRAEMRKGKVVNEMVAPVFPPHWRENVIRGYAQWFPHYDLPDTSEGLFHSFVLGNAEFFVIDRNSAKAWPNMAAFRFDKKRNRWVFDPPPGYALFGKKQMDWLKDKIKSSTADWKFIVSGVPLNGACEKLIKGGLSLQKLHWKNWFGFHIAWGFSQYWAAFPEERNDFMESLKKENINNVIVISGDTHHNVMDDGSNAGLPELNASGLSVETTELARYLKLLGTLTGKWNMRKIWNKGGNGLSSKENKNAFGKIRVVGRQFVELSIIDEDNQTISQFAVPYKP